MVTRWKDVKTAAEAAGKDLAVQGWLCAIIAVAALLASLWVAYAHPLEITARPYAARSWKA